MQAKELYVFFNNDAGDLAELPPVTSVRLGRQLLDSKCAAQEGCCLLLSSIKGLQAPSCISDTKVSYSPHAFILTSCQMYIVDCQMFACQWSLVASCQRMLQDQHGMLLKFGVIGCFFAGS